MKADIDAFLRDMVKLFDAIKSNFEQNFEKNYLAMKEYLFAVNLQADKLVRESV
jgi:hypothetical protein